MHDDLDLTDPGDGQPPVLDAAPRRDLGEGDGIVPAPAFEPGVAGLISGLRPAEKGSKGSVHPPGYVLQDLGVDVGQRWVAPLDERQKVLLLAIAQGSFLNLPSVFALGQEAVVKIPALFQDSFEGSCLLFGGIKTVFEGPEHSLLIAHQIGEVKKITA